MPSVHGIPRTFIVNNDDLAQEGFVSAEVHKTVIKDPTVYSRWVSIDSYSFGVKLCGVFDLVGQTRSIPS